MRWTFTPHKWKRWVSESMVDPAAGVFTGAAVPPLWCALTWARCTAPAAISGELLKHSQLFCGLPTA